jgi:hypothetical protein
MGLVAVHAPQGHEHDPPLKERLAARARRGVGLWWPVAGFFLAVVAGQMVWQTQFDVAGHAAGHLASAAVVFPMTFVAAVLVFALPASARRDVWLWLMLAAVAVSSLVVMQGNLRVVDAVGDRVWSDEQAGALGPSTPGFESGHHLAELGALAVLVAAVAGAVLLWRRRCVSGRVAVAAAVLSVLFPYWIFPGFGIVVLTIAVVAARVRRLRLEHAAVATSSG